MDTMTVLLLAGVGYIVLFRPDIIDGLLANLPAIPAATTPAAAVPAPAQIAVGEQNPSTPAADDEEPAKDEKAADTKKTSSKDKADADAEVAYAWYNQNRIDYTRYPNYFENQRKITIA